MLAGKARRDVPRWKRKKPPGPVIVVKGRGAKRLQRDLRAAATERQKETAKTRPVTTPVFRFRFHLVPFWWLAGMLTAGLAAHAARAVPAAAVVGVCAAAGIVVAARHLTAFAIAAAAAMAVLTAVWVPVLAAAGWVRPVPVLLLGSWACVTVPWTRRYRWRHEDTPPRPKLTDPQVWEERIAAKRLKGTWLAEPGGIPGGRTWTVMLPQGDIVPADVLGQADRIAGAWDKPSTEVVVEPYPDGRQSRCRLTILASDTLARTREWDGQGADPGTGMAVVGRFADGQNARIRFWAPRDGTKHALIAGTTGSGKTYLLDLIVRAAVASGLIVPVILDPQEGQSLPAWRGHVLYASGVDECMRMLTGIREGMLNRSRRLAARAWTDEDGHQVQGMDFYDPHLTGLPLVLVIADEFPLVLKATDRSDSRRAEKALSIAGDIAKLGRKTGVALWPVTQVPSLEELGSRVLRSMLRGGNVVSLRTGERADTGMIGLAADPSQLPPYFADGSPTYGLGYVLGPELRQAPARVDMVPRQVRRVIPAVPELDPAFRRSIETAAA